MLCEICSRKESSVHIVKVIEGNKIEKWLCSECANKNSNSKVYSLIQTELPDIANENLSIVLMDNKSGLNNELKCINCNTKYSEFKENSLLGCSECYSIFRKSIDEIFFNIYGDVEYIGKIPLKENEVIINNKKIIKLKEELKMAILKEEYEKAVLIRDEIKLLEDKNNK